MLYKNSIRFIVLYAVLSGFLGCANEKPVPQVGAPNGVGYAENYHVELESLSTVYGERAEEAREVIGEFPSYAEQLKDPDWAVAASVIEQADEAGRSRNYAETEQDASRVRSFMDEAQDGIARRLTGAVNSEIEKAGCQGEIDVQGKLAYAHKDSVNKELEKQLQGSSEAHRIIDLREVSLGKKNSKALADQADKVTRASYIVNIELAELWNKMAQLEAEEKGVRRILDNELELERQRAGDPEISKAEKKEIDKRIASYKEALSSIDSPLNEARELLKDKGAGIDAIRKEYRDAVRSLIAAYRERAAK